MAQPDQSAAPSNPATQPDEYVRCPYFPEHELRRSRLVYHLMKCEKSPSAPKLHICPFNHTHRIATDKRREHFLICPSKPPLKYNDRAPSYSRTRQELCGKIIDNQRFSDKDPKPADGEEWW